MELPDSWRRMKDELVEETQTWAEGLKEEMSFIGSRLKEFWDDPEKLISTPAEQGAVLPELGIIPMTAVENVKGTRSKEAWERLKAGDPEAMAEYAMDFMGETGGILRKAAVKKLATTGKGIIKVAEGVAPTKASEVKTNILFTMKDVIPAARKLGQEWWDPIGDVKWNFFKDKNTSGDIAADTDLLTRFHPYKADEQTVYHEIAAHGGQYAPSEKIKKALVEYKGELVPATEVLDYMKEVSKGWRRHDDYMENLYDLDPTEMHARVVAIDIAKGVDPEEAFLNRLPKVVKSFENTSPDAARIYRTPMLESVARKAERQEVKSLLQKVKELD